MEMRLWELALINSIQNSGGVETGINYFKMTYEKYEQPSKNLRPRKLNEISIRKEPNDDEEIQFKSNFTIALFNRLSKHIEAIQKNRSYMRVLEAAGVLGDLIKWEKKDLGKLERYKSIESHSVNSMRKIHLKLLYDNLEEFHNFIIVSADEKEILVHKEIIVLFSDYFYQVIKFGGTETRREGYLILENLEHKEVNLLVEYIYKKSFDFEEEDLVTALNLLKELMAYPNEKKTQEDLKDSIKLLFGTQIENGTFFSMVLPEIGFMFHTERLTFPRETAEEFIQYWIDFLADEEETDIDKEKICQIIHKSLKEQEKKMEILAMEEKFDGKLENMKLQIDNRVLKIENDVKEMKSDMKEIKSTLSEFAKELKRKRSDSDEEEDEIVPTRRVTRLSSRRNKIRRVDGDKDISS